MRRAVGSLLLIAGLLGGWAAPATAAPERFPESIVLPDGFQPEGIDVSTAGTFYVGSIPTGAIYKGDVRTGEGRILVPGGGGRAAIGVEAERGRLFVAGGTTGHGYVYDTGDGALLADLTLATGASFVNDVVVTRRAAWFTDSINPVLYRVALAEDGTPGAVTTLAFTGDLVYRDGFNVNGIEAFSDGRTLVVVQSNTGQLHRVDPDTGATTLIDVGPADVGPADVGPADVGGATFANGDGLLRRGSTLYVVQNRLNTVAEVRLRSGLRQGRLVRLATDEDFDVPTTIGRFRQRLYVVNARFTTPPGPSTTYTVESFAR